MGRDLKRLERIKACIISTHTPTWGATFTFNLVNPGSIEFQLTRPRGARLFIFIFGARVSRISTHTPTWGATIILLRNIKKYLYFNSHAHVGRDRFRCVNSVTTTNFNSHAHVGRDCTGTKHKPTPGISTHTPTWGATSRTSKYALINSFQLTRPRGARPFMFAKYADDLTISTHTPTWGATRTLILPFLSVAFQLTRPRGARHFKVNIS